MIDEILEQLNRPQARVLDLLESCGGERHEKFWRQDARLYRGFGRRLIGAGHPTRAFDLVREGLIHHPGDLELKYLSALALSRGRNITKATEYVHELLAGLDTSLKLKAEALSLAGRLHKDKYERATDSALKIEFAAESAGLYEQAYAISRDWFPAINAATMSLLAGKPEKARELAALVVEQTLRQRHEQGTDNDYWRLATLGEAHCILGNLAEAASAYRLAVQQAQSNVGDVASMRRNLHLLREKAPISQEILDVFNLGRVVVFSGHMIDQPSRTQKGLPPRFPPDLALAEQVAIAIQKEIEDLKVVVGYCSAACGSDILFAEQMLKRGAELHVVLPFNREDFYTTSVDFGLNEMASWRRRCEDILTNRQTEVHYATKEPYLADEVLFDFVNRFTQGLAINHAARIWVEPCVLAVIDPASQKAIGGTAFFVERWQAAGRPARLIDLADLRCRVHLQPGEAWTNVRSGPTEVAIGVARREVKAMLFADVKNFSRLTEEQAPWFFLKYLKVVAEVVRESARQPAFCDTWGDGLYIVFDHVPDCADFALRLLERIETMDWSQMGLPPDTTVRIGLHAGPVYPGDDPLTGKKNFFGSHVNRAARIEPVTTPGCAFASEQFAALLTLEAGGKFTCEYIGTETLAKGYDRCPLYRLGRR